ncbi:MAG: hypothetical protein ACYC3I_24265 [Gemmataceae bacterium]
MRPCGPAPCLRFETCGAVEAGKHWLFLAPLPSGEALFVLGFHSFGTSGTAELPEPLLQRLLCHALLQCLPDEGLDEAVQSLGDMNEFYRLPRYVPPPPLPRKSIPVRMGKPIIAPVYPVTED